MRDRTNGRERTRGTKLRVVRDGEGSALVSPQSEFGHRRELLGRIQDVSLLLESYDPAVNSEELYTASYDVARRLFRVAASKWPEDVRLDVQQVLDIPETRLMPLMYYSAQRRGPGVTAQTVDIAREVSSPSLLDNIELDEGVELFVPTRSLNCLIFMGAMAQNVARDTEAFMWARVRSLDEGQSNGESVHIGEALDDFRTDGLTVREMQSMNRFVIGYSYMVVEEVARGMGYPDDVARQLANIIAYDHLNDFVHIDEDGSGISRECNAWVYRELELKALLMGHYRTNDRTVDAETGVSPSGISLALAGTAEKLDSHETQE